ncbi:MAG TPA: SRPBCC domain-containing protein [Thermoanaerobaculia bacterium]|nr:SRPBCC domain-containing protein [Thermoanaerobaculia bacterium]
MFRRVLFTVIALGFASATALSEVVNVSSGGFLLKHEADVKAEPAVLYETLTAGVAGWWNPAHTYSGDARNLSIAAVPGGCFCEKLPGGGVLHMTVVYAAPGKALRMTGALGPLQGSGLAGSLTWNLAKIEGGTRIVLTYGVGGYMPGGLEKVAPLADAMLGEQLQRLKSFAETGSPIPAPK